MKSIRGLIALLLLSVGACGTSGPAVKPGCEWTSPIYLDKDDVLTERTERAIIALNEAGEKICGWQPPQ